MARLSSLTTELPALDALHIAGWREHAAFLMNQHWQAIGFARFAKNRRQRFVALAAAARHRQGAAAYLRACRLHASGLDLSATLDAAGLANPFGSNRA